MGSRPLHRATLATLAALALLAGCDGRRDEPLFPLEAGRRWEYRLTTTMEDPALPVETEWVELRAGGREEIGGSPAWRRTSNTGMAYWLRSDDTGVVRVASQGPLDRAPRSDPAGRYVLRKPYVAGTAWEADTTLYVLQRRNEFPRELRHLDRYRTLPVKYRIAEVDQKVKVPAGEFSGCLLVQGLTEIKLYSDEALAFKDVPITTREWYCPGVGLVRQERLEPAPTKFLRGGSVLLELTAWR